MRSLPRILAGVVAAATVSLLAGACDTSPVAASVDGQLIKETALNAELSQLAANPRYITAVESSAGSISDVPGTYTTGWTAHVLTEEVQALAVRQYLAARHQLPTASMLTAARTVEAADYSSGGLWEGFPASYRDVLTQRTAELATLEPPTAPSSQIAAAYKQYAPYFFSQVCVRQAAFSASSPSGAVDYPASLAQAQQATSGARLPGNVTCYDPEQFEGLSPGLISTVLGLAPGHASAPQKTGYGYQVVQVVSRTPIPLAGDLTRALSVAIELDRPSPVLNRVLARARVRVNPAYGTWSGSVSTGYAVTPPAATKS